MSKEKIYLVYPKKIGTIAPEIYGHFSEHIGGVFYGGLYVGKDSDIPNIKGFRADIIEKLRKIAPPVLRWPGGCFAETYNWRDGIGENRPVRRNWWTPNDNRYEPNTVGTHEFIDLCNLIGAKPYFAANLTASDPLSIRDWMDYCLSPRGTTTLALEREKNGSPEPFDIPFWGVGNENWGGGGNMRPEYYADEYRRFSALMRNVSRNAELYACGTDGFDYSWTHGVMPTLKSSEKHLNGFAMHYYCGFAGDPLNFTEAEWDQQINQALRMEEIIDRNWNIISAHGMQKHCPLIVDEWGCWHPGGSGPSKGYNLFEQQSTMRDAMVSALTLNIFNNNCDKVRMANVAQLCNNLHALFLTLGKDMTVTPTYHVFDMFKYHKGADAIESIAPKTLSVSASVKDGATTVTIGNLSCTEDAEISLSLLESTLPEKARMILLTSDDMHAHNTLENPERVKPIELEIDPRSAIALPKASIATIIF